MSQPQHLPMTPDGDPAWEARQGFRWRFDGCQPVATVGGTAAHSPILMAHPGADLLWIDGDGITRRSLADVPHWRDMRRFMADLAAALGRLLA